ncbi:MAG: hypothetical protein CEN88_236 [Candidatus Berkelbacteria bacterium Licking1014_2]|uniref:Uncharacterized protein n=1 Tax=Candidatus Berkelbacteria bacterium Licking1014_2 TaxID=2017146 RepID=A0A554LVU7_9BACT|nr:MAG: hypothetical protein CEN88_236 [Candidatus Berkelbacteria bacterium Licking1014_2]
MPQLNKTTKKIGREYFKTVAAMLGSAFGLIAALAWNEAIRDLIDRYISPGSTLLSKFIYAIIATILVVLVAIWLGRLAQIIDKKVIGD